MPTGALARQLFEEEDIHDSPGEVKGEIDYAEEEEPDNQEDVNWLFDDYVDLEAMPLKTRLHGMVGSRTK